MLTCSRVISLRRSRFHPPKLHGKIHDRRNDVARVLLQGVNSLGSGHVGLRHDKLDVLRFDPSLVDVTFLFDFLNSRLRRLRRFRRGGVRLEGVLQLRSLGSQILHLGFTEDDVRVGTRGVEHIRRVDHEHRLLALAESNTLDIIELVQAQLLHSLASLLLGLANVAIVRCEGAKNRYKRPSVSILRIELLSRVQCARNRERRGDPLDPSSDRHEVWAVHIRALFVRTVVIFLLFGRDVLCDAM